MSDNDMFGNFADRLETMLKKNKIVAKSGSNVTICGCHMVFEDSPMTIAEGDSTQHFSPSDILVHLAREIEASKDIPAEEKKGLFQAIQKLADHRMINTLLGFALKKFVL